MVAATAGLNSLVAEIYSHDLMWIQLLSESGLANVLRVQKPCTNGFFTSLPLEFQSGFDEVSYSFTQACFACALYSIGHHDTVTKGFKVGCTALG